MRELLLERIDTLLAAIEQQLQDMTGLEEQTESDQDALYPSWSLYPSPTLYPN